MRVKILAMIAMELGKHVYMEKPLAHSVWECRTLKKADIISQTSLNANDVFDFNN